MLVDRWHADPINEVYVLQHQRNANVQYCLQPHATRNRLLQFAAADQRYDVTSADGPLPATTYLLFNIFIEALRCLSLFQSPDLDLTGAVMVHVIWRFLKDHSEESRYPQYYVTIVIFGRRLKDSPTEGSPLEQYRATCHWSSLLHTTLSFLTELLQVLVLSFDPEA